jgi:hypothetical protein
MSGRPVQFLTAAALAVAASFVSVSAASAGCYSGCGYSYAAPVVQYAAPVVYSYSYAAPVTYGSSCNCGYAATAPMYVVNQGPAYTDQVPLDAEPYSAYEGGSSVDAYPNYAGGGTRWNRGYGYRGYGLGYRGYGLGYRGYGLGYRARGFGYRGRGFGYRGAVGPGRRFAVGARGIHRGGMHAGGMHRMHAPRQGGGMRPGVVNPMGGPRP